MMTIESLKVESLKLDKGARKELAYFIIDSLLQEGEELELSPEQKTILDERLDAFTNNRMEFIPSENVIERIRQKHGL